MHFLQKISAKMQIWDHLQFNYTWCRPDRYANSKFIIKTYFYIVENACDYIVSVETL